MSVTVQNMLDFVTNLQQRIAALELKLKEQETLSVYYAQTLRDQFAMAALTGLTVGLPGMLGDKFVAYARGECNAVLVERAYVLADAMLAERAKGAVTR